MARRSLSRRFARALTDEELASRSGLALSEIKGFSWMLTWRGVPTEKVLAFMRACGVDVDDRRALERQWRYFNQTGSGSHLRSSPLWETLFKPLVIHAEVLKGAQRPPAL